MLFSEESFLLSAIHLLLLRIPNVMNKDKTGDKKNKPKCLVSSIHGRSKPSRE